MNSNTAASAREAAEAALRDARTGDALRLLQDAVRTAPEDARLRIFLFQLLCVEGQWPRALQQLGVCAELDASALPMRDTYSTAIQCELLRSEVFAGRRSPMLFGEPEPWLALLIESLLREGRGEAADAQALRQQAFDAAPASPGRLDDQAFAWIADADMRLGPVLEAIVNGRYCWVPFARLQGATLHAPADLRDMVWLPAELTFVGGGESPALIPVRYAGSERVDDSQLRLSRRTDWREPAPGVFTGLGQRTWATDGGEFGLLQCRRMAFDHGQ